MAIPATSTIFSDCAAKPGYPGLAQNALIVLNYARAGHFQAYTSSERTNYDCPGRLWLDQERGRLRQTLSNTSIIHILLGTHLMTHNLKQLLINTPNAVSLQDCDVPDDIDVRRSCVDVLFVNIIGINVDSADWLPNDDPPHLDERLAWIWFVYPSLANEILDMISGDFRLLLECYRDNRMDGWWAHMTRA